MKKIIVTIIGLTAFLAVLPTAGAKYCDPLSQGQTGGTYRDIYCDIKYTGFLENKEIDSELIKVVAEQVGYPEKIVELILNEGELMDSQKLNDFINENNLDSENNQPIDFASLPADIKDAWRDSAKWADVFSKIYTAYDKEKVLYHTKKSLEYEFKSSEKYWDGQINTTPVIGGDAPFDLIVDLNLIEIVLFGKQAEWMNDVYSFPVKEKGGGKGEGAGEEKKQAEGGKKGAIEGQAEGETEGATNKEKESQAKECVASDNPNADRGDHPGSKYAKSNCGNRKIDTLSGEECDDGNKKSGDGCNQYCMLEKSGAGLVCQDTEAVTFQKPQSSPQPGSQSGPQSGQQPGPQLECPEGTFPSTDVTMPTTTPIEPKYPESPQPENYPGPNVGGTFKEFPKSARPPCPTGQSELKIQVGTTEESTCIPTEFCSNLQSIGKDASAEFMYCVNLIKENRPETPYQMNDGCIDCHIAAMADAVDKALEGNVSPLENTTSAFGISSRWGPKFSFNLTTAMKTTLQLFFSPPSDPVKEAQKAAEKYKKDNEAKTTTISSQESGPESLVSQQEAEQQAKKTELEDLQNYSSAGGVISDQEFYSRITPLLNQMEAGFNRLRNKYTGLAGSLNLHKKPTCK